jgi:D-alanyl-D-alanine carboxypeptidase (penicillin-binding protein 5/6)
MKHSLLAICIGFSVAVLQSTEACAQRFETKARQAYLVEASTGAILLAKAPDEPFPPASLVKLMTMEVVFDALAGGRLRPDQTFRISENAWRTGGAPSGTSTMFAKVRSEVAVSDLVQGVIVQAANDGAIALAEGMAGSEAAFAQVMNERAQALGLDASRFSNATGLPAEGQAVTARDLVALARHIWRTYPDRYGIYAQPDFTWNGITQRNRNPLLRLEIGADGMGTGYTEVNGYSLLGVARSGDLRFFGVLAGLASEAERADEARALFEWASQSFQRTTAFRRGEVIGEADVYGGEKGAVTLKVAGPTSLLLPSAAVTGGVEPRIVYEGPLQAPVREGDQVASLEIWIGGTFSQSVPLYAAETVEQGSIYRRAADAVGALVTGLWRRILPS